MEYPNSDEGKPQQEAQSALSASEIRYRRLFESAKDGILILNAETGEIDDVNPFLVNLLGYSKDQFLRKFIWDIGLFKDIVANRDHFLRLKEDRYIRYASLPLEAADGRKIDVEFVSNVYREGRHDVIQCNIRDITERKRAEDLIAAERERLAVTLRSIGDGVIATDAKGNVEVMNIVAEELCGWKQDEVRGQPLASVFNIINENTRLPHENPVDKVLATGKIIELANHTVIISKYGVERIIADSAAPIRDSRDRIIGVVLVFRDITEKQKMLETIQKQQKLESLGLLAGGIAHDFNNLMAGLFGYIDLALLEAGPGKVANYLSKSMLAIERARGLTRQLLTFAKGGAPVRRLTPLIPLIEETAQFALSGSHVSCRYEFAPDLHPCVVDKGQICQVIGNIVINAQQAMPAGGEIEVRAHNAFMGDCDHPELARGDYVKISVTDHGIGMSKKTLSMIFDPFFTTKPQGHGLGLATCYSIVQRHGGSLEAESVLDAGSSFHIYLPAAPGPGLRTAEETPLSHHGSGTILIMDDEELVRETLRHLLSSFGYTVVGSKNGREAVDFFAGELKAGRSVAAVILDLTVPGDMGGKEAIGSIRKLSFPTPVFVSSGYAHDPIMSHPEEYGFTASLCKPFRISDLVNLLNRHLGPSGIAGS